jgi:hypothetical protein
MNYVQQGEPNPSAFRVMIFCGLGCLLIGLATPLIKGDKSAFSQRNGDAVLLLFILAIPMVFGALKSSSRIAIGIAAGAALFSGLVLGFLWAFDLTFLTGSESGISPDVGLYFLIGASVLFVVAALTSIQFRSGPARSGGGSGEPVPVLGVVATVVTVVGALIPSHHIPFKAWMGFDGSGWVGFISVSLLAGFAFIGCAGFLGGRWGLGLVAGFAGEILVTHLAAGSRSNYLALVSESNTDWSPLARIGFFATITLLVIHMIMTASASTPPAAQPRAFAGYPTSYQTPSSYQTPPAPSSAPTSAGQPIDENSWWDTSSTRSMPSAASSSASVSAGTSPAQWASDPFGRHQHRFWNGSTWTDQVASNGISATDPPVAR